MLALKVANTNANAAAMKATAGVQTGTRKPYSFLKKFAEKKAEHPLKQKLQARQAAWKAKREAKKQAAATVTLDDIEELGYTCTKDLCYLKLDDLAEEGDIVQFRLDDLVDEDLEEMTLDGVKDAVWTAKQLAK